jgi:hypothetical protein
MPSKLKGPSRSQLTFTCPPKLRKHIDSRSKELSISRATYLQQLIRTDMLNAGKPFVIHPSK